MQIIETKKKKKQRVGKWSKLLAKYNIPYSVRKNMSENACKAAVREFERIKTIRNNQTISEIDETF